jgi:hypothetical protein
LSFFGVCIVSGWHTNRQTDRQTGNPCSWVFMCLSNIVSGRHRKTDKALLLLFLGLLLSFFSLHWGQSPCLSLCLFWNVKGNGKGDTTATATTTTNGEDSW